MSIYIGYTGSAGVGKSTSVFEMARMCKIDNPYKRVAVITETASESPMKINTETTWQSQLWIFTKQINRELELLNKYDIVISDRTCFDCIAYTRVAGFLTLADAMMQVASTHSILYTQIIFKSIANNNYFYKDGIRSQDTKFRQDMEDRLIEIYKEAGLWDNIIKE